MAPSPDPPPRGEPGFGELLRELRFAAGLSQEALAERARLSAGAVSTLERGSRKAPQQQTVALLAAALDLSPADRARLEAAAAAGRRRRLREVPAAGAAAAPHNLPNVLTTFHGRERDVGELASLLATRRFMTLLGAGGVGKTRLALESARGHLSSPQYRDGVWFIDLAPLTEGSLVAPTIARVLSVRERSNEPLLETLVAAARSKQVLLVLDNCEHLIEECARVSSRLLSGCERLTIVATSREALDIEGERIVPVTPLAVTETGSEGPAIRLFLDRAGDAAPGRIDDDDLSERERVAQICTRLDGIPLALELAAARVRELTLQEIVEGLDSRFALLHRGRRGAAPRQTLHGMVDWSVAFLERDQRRLFERLAVFAGGFNADAVRALGELGSAPVNDALARLVACSLVAIDERDDETRFRLLETTHAYASERLLSSGEYDEVARRHAEHFLQAASAFDAAYGRRLNRDALASSNERDLDNYREALRWALGGGDAVLGARLAAMMFYLYNHLCLFSEGLRWCGEALEHAGDAVEPGVRSRLHFASSVFAFSLGRMDVAAADAERAVSSLRSSGDPRALSRALSHKAQTLLLLREDARAAEAALEAIDRARDANDPFLLALALRSRTLIDHGAGTDDLRAMREEALALFRSLGDAVSTVAMLNTMAEAAFVGGDYRAALAYGEEALATARQAADKSNIAGGAANVAAYALAAGEVATAARAARESLQLARDIGSTMIVKFALQHTASVAAFGGHAERGARLLGAANRLYDESGIPRERTEQYLYERTHATLREALDGARIDELVAEGEALETARAVDEALR